MRAHLAGGKDDGLVGVRPTPDRVDRFCALIELAGKEPAFAPIRAADGRPLGADRFVDDLERRLARPIARRAPGRQPARKIDVERRLL